MDPVTFDNDGPGWGWAARSSESDGAGSLLQQHQFCAWGSNSRPTRPRSDDDREFSLSVRRLATRHLHRRRFNNDRHNARRPDLQRGLVELCRIGGQWRSLQPVPVDHRRRRWPSRAGTTATGFSSATNSITIAQITGRDEPDVPGGRAESEPFARAGPAPSRTRPSPWSHSRPKPGLDPEGGGALVLSHTGEGHGPNAPSGLAHGDQYWSMHPGGANFLFCRRQRSLHQGMSASRSSSRSQRATAARSFRRTSSDEGWFAFSGLLPLGSFRLRNRLQVQRAEALSQLSHFDGLIGGDIAEHLRRSAGRPVDLQASHPVACPSRWFAPSGLPPKLLPDEMCRGIVCGFSPLVTTLMRAPRAARLVFLPDQLDG